MTSNYFEKASGLSKNLVAVVAFASLVSGGIGGFLSAFLFLNKELEVWRQIKASHDVLLPNSEVVVYNHAGLGDDDIAAIRVRLNLPEFGTFALQTDVPTKETVMNDLVERGFVTFGQRVSLQGVTQRYLFDNSASNSVANNVVMSEQQSWTIQPGL